jgi:phage terminase large subunit-like protein
MQRPPLAPDGLPEGMPDQYGIPTLGWGVLAWGQDFLAQPDGDTAGDAWLWTPTQARIVAWWYAVDENGRWLYRRGQVVLPKGAGKSPLAAALCCCELAGEVKFDGFDASGEAVGRPHPSPHVQLAAVSADQTDNTMSLVLAMLREGPAAELIDGLDPGLTRIRTRNGILKPVTASSSSREGERLTAAILDETHLWDVTKGGHRLAKVVRRNLGKLNGRSIETTNAWMPGEDTVAELTSIYADKIAEQRSGGQRKVRDEGLLRYHPQAFVADLGDEDELRLGLEQLYQDSPWIDVDRLMSEVYDPATHPADARRFYLNQVVTAADQLVTPEEWAHCEFDDVLEPGQEITLGFDGSKSEDSTVLVAMRVDDRFASVVGAMEKPEGSRDWEVDREFFDGLVASMFAQYRVVGFFSDVAHFESYVDKWSADYGAGLVAKATTKSAVGWDMRGNLRILTAATERLVAGIQDGSLRHDGGSLLRRHVLNARRRPNQYGVSFGKERRDSPRKVDAFAALQLADMARADVVAARSKKVQRSGRVW